MSTDAAYLLQRIDDLDDWWMRTPNGADRAWLLDDAAELVLDVARYLRSAGDLAALDLRLRRVRTLDIEALRTAADIFSRAAYALTLADGSRFESQSRLDRLRSLPEAVAYPDLDPLEILLRLSFLGDDPMDALLTAAEDLEGIGAELNPLIQPKLALLSDDDAPKLLSEYVAQTDPTREVFIPLPEATRRDLARVTSAADARDKIGRYVLRDRPQAARAAMQKSVPTLLPAIQVGLARVLSWTQGSAQPATMTRTEQRSAKQIGRLRLLWTSLLKKNDTENLAKLADALGVATDSPLLRAPARTAAARGDASVPDWAALRFVLRAAVATADLIERDVPGHVSALWAYKLGLEVMLPGTRNEILKRRKDIEQRELALQQQVCRFLVERHIHAYGTRFGPAQVDLLAFDPITTLIIETKLTKSTPSNGSVNRWLSQLLSYLNQEPLKNRGALVVFNTGAVPITTQGRILLVKDRVYIVPINLCEVTPSGRNDAIEVVESPESSELVLLRRPVAVGNRKTARSRSA